jgi:signal transduction histidine kinase/DNA-binding response OmpR family regulator/streptogramin lyase
MKWFIAFTFSLLVVNGIQGQEFRYLRSQDGLFDGEINSISQDSSGMMWFGTWSGLISYNGISFKLYRPEIGKPNSLPDKKIKKIFIDSMDNHWIVSGRSLSLYDPLKSSFTTIKFNRKIPIGLEVLNLCEINNYLIIHAIEGLYYYPFSKIGDSKVKAERLKFKVEQPSDFYISYSASFGQKLLIVTEGIKSNESEVLFASLDTTSNQVTLKIENRFSVPAKVNSMAFVESEDCIYMATVNGVFVYSVKNKIFVKSHYFNGMDVRNIIYTSNHMIYASASIPELLFIDLHRGITGSYPANPYNIGSILNSNILSLFEDFSGNLWVGHQGQGLTLLNLSMKEFYTHRVEPWVQRPLMSNTIMCFNGTDNEILIGCRTGGLNVMQKGKDMGSSTEFEKVAFTHSVRDGVFKDGIWDIAKESDSVFWVGTDIGLLRLIKSEAGWKFDQSEPPLYGGIVRKIFIDENKNIWCGTWLDGLIFIPSLSNNPIRKSFRYRSDPNNPESLSDNFVQCITLDSKKRLWIGTVSGFNLLKTNYENIDLSGNIEPQLSFKRYPADKPGTQRLNNNEVNCIFENFDGKIWITTQGGGINILDPETDKFSYLTTSDGLPSNDILGILKDDSGNLWISTNQGLVAYNQYNESPLINIYDSSDGIQGEMFMVNSYYKSADGEMYFGGNNGFTRFYPAQINPNKISPKVSFTNLRFGNRTIEVGDTIWRNQILEKSLNATERIKLPYNRNTFNVGISAFHFQNPEGNRISYLLKGYDDIWRTVPATRQYIYFTNLPSGRYNLIVKSISSDNIESVRQATLQIEILHPWYRSWYMAVVYILIIGFLLALLIYYIINRQKIMYQRKLDSMALENNESKMVFLTNIAHELRTPLSLVIAPIDDIVQNYNTIDPSWKNHLMLIHRNSKYLHRLINQIVDFRRLSAGKLNLVLQNTDVTKLISEVVHNFKFMENTKNVNLVLNVPESSIYAMVDIQKIEEILYNLLSNAFKNTEKGKTIEVKLELYGTGTLNQLKFSVFNEGNDISDQHKSRIFERFYKTDEKKEGAGIGLSFSKSLVEMHGGTIEVESVYGKGVVFNVFIPYNISMENEIEEGTSIKYTTEEEAIEESSLTNENQNTGYVKEVKIVIVEDNDEMREFLKSVLSRFYTCFECKDGNEGWEMVKDIVPDIVITDIIMPNKDGYELCKQIKENLKTCHIPVILLTAKNSDRQIISGYNVGADAYVTKPFDMNLILSQISRLIKNRELIREKYIKQNFMVEVSNSTPSKDDEFIINIRNILEENISDPEFNVQGLSSQMNISTTQLYRKLKILTGFSPVEFIRVIKLQKAYNLLNSRNNTVKEVCYLSGFNNLSYFIKCFKEHFGVTPANFRDNGLGDEDATL